MVTHRYIHRLGAVSYRHILGRAQSLVPQRDDVSSVDLYLRGLGSDGGRQARQRELTPLCSLSACSTTQN